MIWALLLLAAGQAAPVAPPPASAEPQPDPDAFMRSRGFSDAGIAVLKREGPRGDAAFHAAARKGQALDRELSAAIRAPVVDLEKIADLLTRRDALVAELASSRTRSLLATLRALPAADRKLYLRVLDPGPPDGPRPLPVAPPAPPAPPPLGD